MSGDYTGGSYVNDAGTEQRGNVFDIYADATLYALKVELILRLLLLRCQSYN